METFPVLCLLLLIGFATALNVTSEKCPDGVRKIIAEDDDTVTIPDAKSAEDKKCPPAKQPSCEQLVKDYTKALEDCVKIIIDGEPKAEPCPKFAITTEEVKKSCICKAADEVRVAVDECQNSRKLITSKCKPEEKKPTFAIFPEAQQFS